MNKFHFLALSSFCFVVLPAHAQPANSVQEPAPVGPSLRAHLQLKAAQIEDLNTLYDDWVTKRGDFSAVRARARQILTPLQRAQLDSIVKNQRLRIRDDQYSQLLLTSLSAPNEQNQREEYRIDESGRDNERQRQSKKSRNRNNTGSGSYGVYGGYGYGGPNYGVYGNYGQGNVGVGATIGRYGPSIGVNIGRIFGSRWLR